jgi:hypothetical protein
MDIKARTTGSATVVIGAILVLLAIWALWRRNMESPTVHFLLPAGFDGHFVVAAPKHADSIGRLFSPEEENFRIPSNGVLVVDDDSVLRSWHRTVVSTTDGKLVRATPGPADDRLAAQTVFLSRGSSYGGKFRRHWYFFGTPGGDKDVDEMDQLEERLERIGKTRLPEQFENGRGINDPKH